MPDPRKHHTDQTAITRAAGCPTNAFCAAVSVARALAGGRRAPQYAVAERLKEVSSLWRRKHPRQWDANTGTWTGHLMAGWQSAGLEGQLETLSLDRDKVGWSTPSWSSGPRRLIRQGFPTMAQWERSHRHVKRAIVRGTGHVGYFERDANGVAHIFNMGARKRVDYAFILEEV